MRIFFFLFDRDSMQPYPVLLLNIQLQFFTPHQYAYFAQIDWLEKKYYTSIKSTSRNLGAISFRRLLKCAVMSTKDCVDKVGIIRNE